MCGIIKIHVHNELSLLCIFFFFIMDLLYCHFKQLLLTASHLIMTNLLTSLFFLDLVELQENL